ncbi:hypothetical protein [Legionella shakespearei]|uniref:Uncharacterized protein n=1 Tax=Legionella shakespearei DSM 23087 TaxID=1122169 RepID=A0A0W0YHV0_9GAMM|nr:hypothetical protein [Legionella shakespearei]KTD56223.1 hypothetical protein Lsha_2911 [Legionella shakespearei DSM 23087]
MKFKYKTPKTHQSKKIDLSGNDSESSKSPGKNGGSLELTLAQATEGYLLSSNSRKNNGFFGKTTLLSLASKGGNGCDGLRVREKDGYYSTVAEEGTNGSDAGNGGHVCITVTKDNLALLDAIVAIDTRAGKPGKAGVHGVRAANGKNYSYPLYPGREGHAGSCTFRVLDDGSIKMYESPYQLSLSLVSVNNLNPLGLNPEDTIEIQLALANTGPMDSPENISLGFVSTDMKYQGKEKPEFNQILAGRYKTVNISFQVLSKNDVKKDETRESSLPSNLNIRFFAYNPRLDKAYNGSEITVSLPVASESSITMQP